jgi:hypothetical protein
VAVFHIASFSVNSVRNISSTQIVWAVGLLLGLAAAVVVGSAIGHQDFSRVSMIVGGGIGVAVMLLLGNKYWMLIPFSLAASRLPTIPVGGRAVEFPELAITVCSVMFFLRLASRKEKLIIWRPASIPILLFMIWVGMVFALNPIGLAAMGSSVGGARFYIKLALAFAAFLILSSRTYTERDMRWILGFILLGSFFTLGYGITSYALTGPAVDVATGMVQDEFYTWHQELNVVAFTAAFLIFARWSPKEVFTFQRAWVALAYVACLLLVLLSGKRMGVVAVFLTPLVSAVLCRQFVYVLIAAVLAAASLGFLVAGHGNWFQLPLVAQRTISFLPGDWDAELQGMRGGTDDWRAELRHWAIENVKKDPLIGRGFAVDLQETVGAILAQQRGGGMDVQVAGYALGRSWHNTWLGYAADFGIPLSLIQALIYLSVLVLSYRCFKYYGNTSSFGVFAVYLFIFTVRDILGSHTGGHSALDAWQRWWMYGVLVSIYYTLPKRKKPAPLPVKPPSLRRDPAPAMALPTQGRRTLTGTSPWADMPRRG